MLRHGREAALRRRASAPAPAPRRPGPTEPADDLLTTEGLASDVARGRVLLVACGALAHEILALIRLNGWDHLALRCLPAILHNRPERIAEAVEEAVRAHRAGFERVFVVYADCGTGGRLRAACDRLGVEMVAGPHCYAFYEGVEAFEARDEMTAFYLTDFLVRQFDAFVWRPLGLDRHPELRDAYFGHYTTLVHQAQVDDPALAALARSHAERLGLAFERRPTGYGDLATALASAARRSASHGRPTTSPPRYPRARPDGLEGHGHPSGEPEDDGEGPGGSPGGPIDGRAPRAEPSRGAA